MPAGSQPWLGKWESSDKPSVNWEAVSAAYIITGGKTGVNPKIMMDFSRDGDSYTVKVDVPENHHETTFKFKMGEELSNTREGQEIKSKYMEDGPKLLAEVKIPGKNKVVHDTYEVSGNELVKISKVDGIEGRKWFKKA